MLLYKFRSFQNFEYLLDLLLYERLFCSDYKDLNDPFEGQVAFSAYVMGSQDAGRYVMGYRTKFVKSIDEFVNTDGKIRVCSLSQDAGDVRMWSLYSDSHRGAVIEVDFSGLECDLHKVTYHDSIRDLADLGRSPAAEEILKFKTKHWEYETEYRVIQSGKYFDISGRIKRVVVGVRADDEKVNLLRAVCGNRIVVQQASLNHDGVRVIF